MEKVDPNRQYTPSKIRIKQNYEKMFETTELGPSKVENKFKKS